MASRATPRLSSLSFKCLPRPTWDIVCTWAPWSRNTGLGLPVPQGSSSSRDSTASTTRCWGETAMSTSRTEGSSFPWQLSATACRRAWARAGILSSFTVKPAARACPPKFSSRWEQDDSRSKRFSSPQERQEPLPMPPSRQIIKQGQAYFSARREATMPTTPWCHWPPASTMALRWGFSSRYRTHCWKISPSISWRSRLSSHSSSASVSARTGSRVRNSSTATSAIPIRPEALIRGASV